jgi:hypothetical protein
MRVLTAWGEVPPEANASANLRADLATLMAEPTGAVAHATLETLRRIPMTASLRAAIEPDLFAVLVALRSAYPGVANIVADCLLRRDGLSTATVLRLLAVHPSDAVIRATMMAAALVPEVYDAMLGQAAGAGPRRAETRRAVVSSFLTVALTTTDAQFEATWLQVLRAHWATCVTEDPGRLATLVAVTPAPCWSGLTAAEWAIAFASPAADLREAMLVHGVASPTQAAARTR